MEEKDRDAKTRKELKKSRKTQDFISKVSSLWLPEKENDMASPECCTE